jgi:hypothetical protein
MRIWSLHPKYLDAKGLVALWRETLLAKHVLEGKTIGYKNHPQLTRFKSSGSPLDCINNYLAVIYEEATHRHYLFDQTKVDMKFPQQCLTVTSGQLQYEVCHLLAKLKARDPAKYQQLIQQPIVDPHPLFKIVEGGVEDWEIINGGK